MEPVDPQLNADAADRTQTLTQTLAGLPRAGGLGSFASLSGLTAQTSDGFDGPSDDVSGEVPTGRGDAVPPSVTRTMPADSKPFAAPGGAGDGFGEAMRGLGGPSPTSPNLGRSSSTGVLSTILSGESFWPSEPRSLHEAGLSAPFIETLILKTLLAIGSLSGRGLAERLALPFNLFDGLFADLRSRKLLSYNGSAPLGDYNYVLTEQGQTLARSYRDACSYVGHAPVPLSDYVLSVEAQATADVTIRPQDIAAAMADISVERDLFDLLGPAVNNGSGMFLYGSPGNGKSTLAERICRCFGQSIWIPRTIVEDGEIIKLFDPAYHVPVRAGGDPYSQAKESSSDGRWVRVQRPTVVVGGELTMDALELRHDDRSGVSMASLQMKSNCGCLLIDDFGRQRMSPEELLNRWIIPLEARHDFLTLATGKKIEVPFEQLILFSTNLDPSALVDEAFLRRIPYKIEVTDPDEAEFKRLFEAAAEAIDCRYDEPAVEHLLERHYRSQGRPLRRCHARDLLAQLRSFCSYHDQPLALSPETIDRIASTYFTSVPTRSTESLSERSGT